MIHIGRAGANLGSFSEDEVRQGLATGRFLSTDLGWKEGMENWRPLSQFEELAPAPPVPPLPEETPAAEASPQDAALPWDDRRQIGFLPAFAETARLVLANPSVAFSRMRIDGSIAGPLLYCLIGGWLGMIASGIYAVLISRVQGPPDTHSQIRMLFYLSPERAVRELKLFIAMGWLLGTLSTVICSAIAHLFLMVAGGARRPYHVSLRVFCFSYGSAQLLQLFPFCGGLLAPVWLIACCVIGLAVAHGTTTGRSLAAMILFLAACFACCVGVLYMAVGASGPDSLRQMLNQ